MNWAEDVHKHSSHTMKKAETPETIEKQKKEEKDIALECRFLPYPIECRNIAFDLTARRKQKKNVNPFI